MGSEKEREERPKHKKHPVTQNHQEEECPESQHGGVETRMQNVQDLRGRGVMIQKWGGGEPLVNRIVILNVG